MRAALLVALAACGGAEPTAPDAAVDAAVDAPIDAGPDAPPPIEMACAEFAAAPDYVALGSGQMAELDLAGVPLFGTSPTFVVGRCGLACSDAPGDAEMVGSNWRTRAVAWNGRIGKAVQVQPDGTRCRWIDSSVAVTVCTPNATIAMNDHGHAIAVLQADMLAGVNKTYDLGGGDSALIEGSTFSELSQKIESYIVSTSHGHEITVTCQ
jgi:hypothetical protein